MILTVIAIIKKLYFVCKFYADPVVLNFTAFTSHGNNMYRR